MGKARIGRGSAVGDKTGRAWGEVCGQDVHPPAPTLSAGSHPSPLVPMQSPRPPTHPPSIPTPPALPANQLTTPPVRTPSHILLTFLPLHIR
jgi:hypothetical protein